MTTMIERMHAEEISREARQVRFSVVAATLITAVFFSIGWVIAHLWLGVVYCALATRVGFREGKKARTPVSAPRAREPSLYG